MPDPVTLRRRAVSGFTELAIIIAGVLIALWADQWWTDRQDLKTQGTYLAALDDDISKTVDSLRELVSDLEAWRDAASTLSRWPQDEPAPAAEEITVMIGKGLFQMASLETRLAAYEDLKTTGRLGLISDADLRRNLAQVDQLLQDIRTSEADLWATQHITIDPYLLAHTDMVAVAKAAGQAYARDVDEIKELGLPTGAELIGDPVGLDPTPLVRDPVFRGLLAFRLVLLAEAVLRYRRLEVLLLEIQGQIASARGESGA